MRALRPSVVLLQPLQNLEQLVVGQEFPRRIDLGVPNDALFVDDEPGPFGAQVDRDFLGIVGHGRVVVEDAVLAAHLASEVAQQRVSQAEFFGEGFVGIVEVNAYAQYLGIEGLELGKIKLEGQSFLRSSLGKGADVEEQHDVLVAPVVGQFDGLPCGRGYDEVRRLVAHLQGQEMAGAAE
jgi:hypothetical protein